MFGRHYWLGSVITDEMRNNDFEWKDFEGTLDATAVKEMLVAVQVTIRRSKVMLVRYPRGQLRYVWL